MSVFLSGIQPSNYSLHLGNYLGAILSCKKIINNLKSNDRCYFMIADLHALTSVHNSTSLANNIQQLIATYMACGIESNDKIIFFQQSTIPAHCELCWILSTIVPLGHLERMTQFKDKKNKVASDEVNSGLLYYPVLMVADIVLYKANYVLVGEDQTQHLEFTRDIVQKFENIFGKDNNDNVFVMPDKIIDQTSKRIMSLGDGTKKMSKSVGEFKDKIFLQDTDDQIASKIKTAKTDSIMGIYYDRENRPEVSNLINIFSAISGRSIQDISNEYKSKNTKSFKDDLTQLLISEISPIRNKQAEILKDKDLLHNILKHGNEVASDVANETLSKVKKMVGLI